MTELSAIKSTFYQSANSDTKSIKDKFLIRTHEFEIISSAILQSPTDGSIQHFLLLGRRGSGKSTLLKRLQIEVECNEALKDKYVAINLAEEQANIYKLHDLLDEVVTELEHKGIDGAAPAWDEENPDEFTKKMLAHLHTLVVSSGKKIILLLDNIDRIFENIGHDAHLLREYLSNYSDIRIIGASTRMTEHFWKYDQPFYDFFRQLQLKPLTTEEVKTLLVDWAEKFKLPKLKHFVENEPGKLETIRILTDGLPRTLQFFVNILLTKEYGTSYEYLQQVMDSVTPLYQERLNSLPPSQRKIILQLAFIWEAAGAAKVAEASRMNNSLISAQLRQLEQKGLVEKIPSGNKNHLYRLSERFFNLWLIFTQGSPHEKRRTRYLTVFLENFYSEDEIVQLADDHLKNLVSGKLTPDKAALLTKILAQSRYLSWSMKDLLIGKTLELKNIPDELLAQLPQRVVTLMPEVNSLLKKGEVNKVKRISLALADQNDGVSEAIDAIILFREDHFDEATRLFKASVEKGFAVSYVGLGGIASIEKKYDEASMYYEKAVEYADNPGSRIDLGESYLKSGKKELAKEQFDKAIEMNTQLALHIAEIYTKEMELHMSIYYVDIAIKAGVPESFSKKAITMYYLNGDSQEAVRLLAMEDEKIKQTRHYLLSSIIVKTWAGIFNYSYEQVKTVVQVDDNLTQMALRSLLSQRQYNMVSRLFGEQDLNLKEKYLPIYYALRMLESGSAVPEKELPKELTDTVMKIVEASNEMAEYLSSKKTFEEYFNGETTKVIRQGIEPRTVSLEG